MADIEPPSFSLGLDLDDGEALAPTRDHSTPSLAPVSSSNQAILYDDLDDRKLGPQAMESDPDSGPDPPRVFRRLRRGPPRREPKPLDDDEIEDFSSSEEDGVGDLDASTKLHSVCSNSKASLRWCGVVAPQLSSLSKRGKKEPAVGVTTPGSLEARHREFPNLTISPLRRFQLLDSDSDDPSVSEKVGEGAHRIDTYSRGRHSAANNLCSSSKGSQSTTGNQVNVEAGAKSCQEDLWKYFSSSSNFDIPTPAFDQVRAEYYQSLKNKNLAQELGSQKLEQNWHQDGPLPPSHRYFFHDDQRIQRLVQARLPFFLPLGVINGRTNQGHSVSNIDYMDQFENQKAPRNKGTEKLNSENGSTSRRKKSKKPNAEEVLHASEGWIDPKSSSGTPKNVKKKRVESNGQSGGRWYTSPEGRKVYVSRSGKELTGQMAYRHYRKETGAGFRKLKKKSNPKTGKVHK